jgi:hypothetical protein
MDLRDRLCVLLVYEQRIGLTTTRSVALKKRRSVAPLAVEKRDVSTGNRLFRSVSWGAEKGDTHAFK